MDRHHGTPSVVMAEKMVTATDASHSKTPSAQSSNHLIPGDARVSAHAAIVIR
jgi:hypothetical protein